MGMPPIPAPPGNVNKINPREAGMVVAAGAVGGFVFWIIAKWTETSLPTVFGSATVPVLMFLGAIAALIGVYFLTASDTTAVRTYIFALLCGVAWDPMINSGVQIVTNAAVKSQTDDLGNKVQQMKDATKTGDVSQITSAVQQTVPAVTAILNNSTDVADAAKRTEIVDKSRQAIGELQTSAAKAPESSVDALKNITLAADKSGQSAVGIDAIQTLDTIAGDAVRSKNVPLSQRIRTSLDYVVNNSNNPAIQSAAKLTLGELNSGAR
jgi:predicted negative regulator of RcsB-dependent stress response